jgi:hypothetical protein
VEEQLTKERREVLLHDDGTLNRAPLFLPPKKESTLVAKRSLIRIFYYGTRVLERKPVGDEN